MSAYPKTTWEDLSALGWAINDVYNAANAIRDGTMNGIDDISLNSGIAAKHQWWSYNATIGTPYLMSSRPQTVTKEQVAWSYDNTQNDRPFEQPWTERWTETTSADVSISTSATVSLNASVTIVDVASTGFDISISVDSSSSQHKERSHELSTSWTMEVGPHEKLTLMRTITTSTTVAEYGQDFGLRADSMVGTNGGKWNGHYYWGMNINWLCDSPEGTMQILGVGRSVEYSFKLIREGPKGSTTKPLPVKSKAVKELAAQPEVALLVPGGEATA